MKLNMDLRWRIPVELISELFLLFLENSMQILKVCVVVKLGP